MSATEAMTQSSFEFLKESQDTDLALLILPYSNIPTHVRNFIRVSAVNEEELGRTYNDDGEK